MPLDPVSAYRSLDSGVLDPFLPRAPPFSQQIWDRILTHHTPHPAHSLCIYAGEQNDGITCTILRSVTDPCTPRLLCPSLRTAAKASPQHKAQ